MINTIGRKINKCLSRFGFAVHTISKSLPNKEVMIFNIQDDFEVKIDAEKKDGEVIEIKDERFDVNENFWLKNLNIGTIFDIGSNEGQFAGKVASICVNADIHCFEPLNEPFQKIKNDFKNKKNFNFYQFALGNENGKKEIFRNEFSPSSSLLPMKNIHSQAFKFTKNVFEEEIEIKKLDDIAKDIKIKSPFFVKIDVQGYEMEVINGGIETINKADIVMLETSFVRLYEKAPLFDDIYSLLRKMDFEYIGSFEQLMRPQDGLILQQDSLFIKKSLFQKAEKGVLQNLNACPICGGFEINMLGEISQTAEKDFSGEKLGINYVSNLYSCDVCSSKFVSPRISEEYANMLYADSPATRWVAENKKQEDSIDELFVHYAPVGFKEIFRKHFLKDNNAKVKILDVGCFNGKLLDIFKYYGFQTYGLDINRDAINKIGNKHKVIVGDTNLITDFNTQFDFITAFDIVEHMYNLDRFWKNIFNNLKKDGVFLLLTGNPDAEGVISEKNKWWYFQFPEHIIFPSMKYFESLQQKFNCKIEAIYHLNHRLPLDDSKPDHLLILIRKL
jgi:FkbM family methyltransferase